MLRVMSGYVFVVIYYVHALLQSLPRSMTLRSCFNMISSACIFFGHRGDPSMDLGRFDANVTWPKKVRTEKLSSWVTEILNWSKFFALFFFLHLVSNRTRCKTHSEKWFGLNKFLLVTILIRKLFVGMPHLCRECVLGSQVSERKALW